jgi:hypothetical protein
MKKIVHFELFDFSAWEPVRAYDPAFPCVWTSSLAHKPSGNGHCNLMLTTWPDDDGVDQMWWITGRGHRELAKGRGTPPSPSEIIAATPEHDRPMKMSERRKPLAMEAS